MAHNKRMKHPNHEIRTMDPHRHHKDDECRGRHHQEDEYHTRYHHGDIHHAQHHHEDIHQARQGQVTVAIIVAIVIIIVISALMYQSSAITRKRTQQQLETQQMIPTKLVPVKEYVQSCLDIWSKEGMRTMGKQGGYLFKGTGGPTPKGFDGKPQGGPTPDFLTSDAYSARNPYSRFTTIQSVDSEFPLVTYSVFKNEGINLPSQPNPSNWPPWMSSDPPVYPYITFPLMRLLTDTSGAASTKYDFTTYLGSDILPPLNKPNVTIPKTFITANSAYKYNVTSIQYQLEEYIREHVLACADFSSPSIATTNIAFNPDKIDARVNVTFTEANTLIELNYNLNMTDKTTGAPLTLQRWVTILPVRFYYDYFAIQYAVAEESLNLLFNISNTYNNDRTLSPRKTKFDNNPSSSNKDYFITYADSDTSHLLDGKPFEFRFGIHNRAPALYYLNRTIGTLTNNPSFAPTNPAANPFGRFLPAGFEPGPTIPLEVTKVQSYKVCARREKNPVGQWICESAKIKTQPKPSLIPSTTEQTLRFENPSACQSSAPLDIPLFAWDPDEDPIQFSIRHQSTSGIGPEPTQLEITPSTLHLIKSNAPGTLRLTVTATDGQYRDWQDLVFELECVGDCSGSQCDRGP